MSERVELLKRAFLLFVQPCLFRLRKSSRRYPGAFHCTILPFTLCLLSPCRHFFRASSLLFCFDFCKLIVHISECYFPESICNYVSCLYHLLVYFTDIISILFLSSPPYFSPYLFPHMFPHIFPHLILTLNLIINNSS